MRWRSAALMLAGLMTASLAIARAQTARAAFEDHYAEVNGVRLHYASVGKGPLILFLHGYPSFWYQWKDQMAEMGRDHLAVGLDMRGHNLSSRPTGLEPYTMKHLVEDIRQFVKDTAILSGHLSGLDQWVTNPSVRLYPDDDHWVMLEKAKQVALDIRKFVDDKDFPKASVYRAPASPRTAWGDPDLQGTWTNATITPFERPASMANKPFLTPAEAAALEARAADQRESSDGASRPGDVGSYNQAWFDSGTRVVSTLQTSLVVDPPDGRVPLRPEALRQREEYDARNGDAPEFMSPWDRCITRGIPGGLFPAGYNNGYQIVQFPGSVVMYYEMIHALRIIPTDGRAHLPSHLRFWDGDSVGRWEGDTLVVDVTNYNGKGWIATNAAAGRMRGVLQSDALHVVERFTRVGAGTLHYAVTIDDPKTYTRPWTLAIPLERDDEYRFFEYACHEGNHAVENVLRSGRALETGRNR